MEREAGAQPWLFPLTAASLCWYRSSWVRMEKPKNPLISEHFRSFSLIQAGRGVEQAEPGVEGVAGRARGQKSPFFRSFPSISVHFE